MSVATQNQTIRASRTSNPTAPQRTLARELAGRFGRTFFSVYNVIRRHDGLNNMLSTGKVTAGKVYLRSDGLKYRIKNGQVQTTGSEGTTWTRSNDYPTVQALQDAVKNLPGSYGGYTFPGGGVIKTPKAKPVEAEEVSTRSC